MMLLVIFLALHVWWIDVSCGASSSTSCPSSCDAAILDAYCRNEYTDWNAPGNLSVGKCTASSTFECVCNARSVIRVPRVGTTCSKDVPLLFDNLYPNCSRVSRCPEDCSAALANYGSLCADTLTGRSDSHHCTNNIFSCMLCNGNILTVTVIPRDRVGTDICFLNVTNDGYTRCKPECDANPHACCSGSRYSACTCHSSATTGYYGGERCTTCNALYTGINCLTPVSQAQVFLNKLGTETLTMVTPLLACLIVFAGMSLLRRPWTYDKRQRPEDVNPNFSDLFVGNFKSKHVPDRPAGSKGMMARRKKEMEESKIALEQERQNSSTA
eukprot:PhF_6_TR5116/c0_g1_i1/m.7245